MKIKNIKYVRNNYGADNANFVLL